MLVIRPKNNFFVSETRLKIGSVGRIFFSLTMNQITLTIIVYSNILLFVAFYFYFTWTCFVILVER